MKVDIVTKHGAPIKMTHGAAGFDLSASFNNDVVVNIYPGETKVIPTGIRMAIPEGYFGGIFARSGLSIKYGLRPANCVGVIDSDYRGEIMVALHNDSEDVMSIDNGLRIAQLIILPCVEVDFNVVDALPDSSRGEGGFGSTGL